MLNATGSALASLAALPDRLRALRVSGTHLELAELSRFHGLSVLDAAGLTVDCALLGQWQLPQLRVLNLSRTAVRGLHGAHLPRSLRKLYLSDTEIGEDDLPERAELPSLETLAVQ